MRQDLGGFEQFRQIVDPQHSRPAKGRIVGGIRSGQPAGMRSRCLGRRRVPSRLNDDDRLGACRATGGRQEFRRLSDGFHVKQDRAATRVASEVVEQIAEIDVGHVAEGNDVRKADSLLRGPVDHRRHQRTRLRDEREVARHRATMRETRVEP